MIINDNQDISRSSLVRYSFDTIIPAKSMMSHEVFVRYFCGTSIPAMSMISHEMSW